MSKHKPINERSIMNQKIREARKLKNLNQHQAAEKMGMLYDTYSKKERNGKITHDWLLKFCSALDISPSFFADVFGAEPSGKLTFKSGSTVEEKLYGEILTEKKETKTFEKKVTEKTFDFELSATEISVLNTYHGLSKTKQKEVLNFINSLR